MGYIPVNIKDRVASGDDKYYIEELSDGKKRLVPAPDSVTEQGTDVNKGLLQRIETSVANDCANIGDILYTSSKELDDTWVLCNGAEIDKDEMPELYANEKINHKINYVKKVNSDIKDYWYGNWGYDTPYGMISAHLDSPYSGAQTCTLKVINLKTNRRYSRDINVEYRWVQVPYINGEFLYVAYKNLSNHNIEIIKLNISTFSAQYFSISAQHFRHNGAFNTVGGVPNIYRFKDKFMMIRYARANQQKGVIDIFTSDSINGGWSYKNKVESSYGFDEKDFNRLCRVFIDVSPNEEDECFVMGVYDRVVFIDDKFNARSSYATSSFELNSAVLCNGILYKSNTDSNNCIDCIDIFSKEERKRRYLPIKEGYYNYLCVEKLPLLNYEEEKVYKNHFKSGLFFYNGDNVSFVYARMNTDKPQFHVFTISGGSIKEINNEHCPFIVHKKWGESTRELSLCTRFASADTNDKYEAFIPISSGKFLPTITPANTHAYIKTKENKYE